MFSTRPLIASLLLLAPCTSLADESVPLVELCKSYMALPKGGEVTSEFIQLKSSCAGFINSAFRMSKPEDGFCRPANYNMDDLVKVYMAWALKNPDRWKEPTRLTMAEALKEAYPCPK
jgi:Rap1a immunity proteins